MGCLLLAYVAVATAATGSFQTDCFYGGGEMDEILPLTLQGEWPGLSYQNPNDAFFTVTEDNAYESLVITKKKWKYVAIDISHLNSDTLTLHLMACDEAWNAIEAQTIKAKNGKEIFTYNLPKCKNLIVSIPNQKGKQFRFNSLQFLKTYPPNAEYATAARERTLRQTNETLLLQYTATTDAARVLRCYSQD